MSIEASVVVDIIDVHPTGTLQIRFLKRLRDTVNGEVVEGWHRTTVDPGVNPAQQIAAVSAHLQSMGLPAIIEAEAAAIRAAQQAKPGTLAFKRDRSEPVRAVVDATDTRTLDERRAEAFPGTRITQSEPNPRR